VKKPDVPIEAIFLVIWTPHLKRGIRKKGRRKKEEQVEREREEGKRKEKGI
jgi:hypothetical protein